jgi:hypothetical protein
VVHRQARIGVERAVVGIEEGVPVGQLRLVLIDSFLLFAREKRYLQAPIRSRTLVRMWQVTRRGLFRMVMTT